MTDASVQEPDDTPPAARGGDEGGLRPLPGPGGPGLRLALATFGLLALELTVIRWMSGQIRIFAYFNNLVLIGGFLGMGLGVAMGKRRPQLYHWLFPVLLVFSAVVGTSAWTGLGALVFPDVSIHLWGAEGAVAWGTFALNMAVVLLLFWGVVAIFYFAGVAVGHFFAQGETLASYSYDLLGSLAGVLGFAAVTATGVGPPVWFAVSLLPLLLLSRRTVSLVAAAGVVGFAAISTGGARYSPYNRIEVAPLETGDLLLMVNRDFHQYVWDLSDERIAAETDTADANRFRYFRDVYDIPYVLSDARGSALIVGAGTGNDAQAALRNGYDRVVSVDIDGTILELGRRLHPEGPYEDARVSRVVNDGRAFLEQYDGPPFDVVSFGLVDSHAMFSSMSSLRLENYLYTAEGLEAAWEQLSDRGHLAVSFSIYAGEWISDRMYWTLARATGRLPVMIHHGMNVARTYIVAREDAPVDYARVDPYPRLVTRTEGDQVATTSDDWPFLYLKPDQTPWGYLLLLVAVVATAAVAVTRVFGAATLRSGFDAPLFFMGGAFLLLETRGVTVLSLLFGSTWTVNVAVFSGILATALGANLWVLRTRPERVAPWFIPLVASLVLLWMVPVGTLNEFGLLTRGVLGGLLIGLPVGFAGIVVSMLLDRSDNPTASLGSNLLGAVLGGCLEYLSMWTGLQALVGLAMLLYLTAGYFLLRGSGVLSVPGAGPSPGEAGA